MARPDPRPSTIAVLRTALERGPLLKANQGKRGWLHRGRLFPPHTINRAIAAGEAEKCSCGCAIIKATKS